MVPYGRPFPPRFPVGLVVGGLFLLFVAGPALHFFPLFLILAFAFLLVPAFAAAGRGLAGVAEARTRERTGRVAGPRGAKNGTFSGRSRGGGNFRRRWRL